MNKVVYAKLRSEVSAGILKLRRGGQLARADGVAAFIKSARKYEDYEENTVGFGKAVQRLEAARSWVHGGLRSGEQVQALGARSECQYEIRNP